MKTVHMGFIATGSQAGLEALRTSKHVPMSQSVMTVEVPYI